MAIDPPYRFDPFQNIVNVNWGTGEEPHTITALFIYDFTASMAATLSQYGEPFGAVRATLAGDGTIFNGWSLYAYWDSADTAGFADWQAAVAEITAAPLRFCSTAWYDPGHHPIGPDGLYWPDLAAAEARAANSYDDGPGGYGDGYRDFRGIWLNATTMMETWFHAGFRGAYVNAYLLAGSA